MMSQMTIQVQQSLLQNPKLKIFMIHKILTICDKNKIQKVKEKSPQTSWPLAKVRAIAVNKMSFCRLTQNYRQTLFITVPRLFTIHLQYRPVTIHEQTLGQHFQELHRAKRLPFDNCSPTFGAWQLDIVTPPLLSSIQLYITLTFHLDKSLKKESRIQKIKKQEPTWELKLSSTNSHLQNSHLSSLIFYFTNLGASSTNSIICKPITLTNYLYVFLQFSSFSFYLLLGTLCFMFSS